MRLNWSRNRKVKCLVFLDLRCKKKKKIKRKRKLHHRRRHLETFPWALLVNRSSSRVLRLSRARNPHSARDSLWVANQPLRPLVLEEVVADLSVDSRWVLLLDSRQIHLRWFLCTCSLKLRNHWPFSRLASTTSSTRGCPISTPAFSGPSVPKRWEVATFRCRQTSSKKFLIKPIAKISEPQSSKRLTLIAWISAKSLSTRRPKNNLMKSSHFWKIISWLKILARLRSPSLLEPWNHKNSWRKRYSSNMVTRAKNILFFPKVASGSFCMNKEQNLMIQTSTKRKFWPNIWVKDLASVSLHYCTTIKGLPRLRQCRTIVKHIRSMALSSRQSSLNPVSRNVANKQDSWTRSNFSTN